MTCFLGISGVHVREGLLLDRNFQTGGSILLTHKNFHYLTLICSTNSLPIFGGIFMLHSTGGSGANFFLENPFSPCLARSGAGLLGCSGILDSNE